MTQTDLILEGVGCFLLTVADRKMSTLSNTSVLSGGHYILARIWPVLRTRVVRGTHHLRSSPPSSLLPPPLPPHFLFPQLGLQSVPKIMHFPPALAEADGGRYATEPSQHMHMAGQVVAEAMSRFVKERTGVSIPIVR